MSENEIDLFKINEVSSYRFYQMPKELFCNPYYKKMLSLESKVAYTLLLDRMALSRINRWFNEKGEIYLIYTRKELMEELRIGNGTACKIFRELAQCKLIKEERLGQGFANRIYIGKIKSESIEEYKKRIYRNAEEEFQEILSSISKNAIWNTNNTDSNNTENVLYNDSEKILLAEKVSLTRGELKTLVSTYGENKTAKIILNLDLYKKEKGKEYESDYNAILNWVINKVERDENMKQNKFKESSKLKFKNYEQREYDDIESFYDNI